MNYYKFLNKQQETDDFSLRAPQDPFTEAGVIASQYNNIMDKLEQSEKQKNIWKNRVSKRNQTCNRCSKKTYAKKKYK